MAATATTKIQISYSEKGTMINVYADTPTELDVLLHAVQDNAGLDRKSTRLNSSH